MSVLGRAAVTMRRLLVRRPWIHWMFVAIAALGAAASVSERTARIDAERRAWGDETTVFVATRRLAPGDRIDAEPRRVPVAMAAPDAIDDPAGLTMRQHVTAGEVIHNADVAAGDGPQALTPPGWLAVPIVESAPSGANVGDRVHVASDGVVLTGAGIVVGRHDDVTMLAVPADRAPAVAAAQGHLTLLLVP